MNEHCYTCLIWGIGRGYDRIINQVNYEMMKGNLKITALIAKPDSYVGLGYDGVTVIRKEEICYMSYDYVIIAVEKYYEEIFGEALSLGISEEKLINGMAFLLPWFDFRRYARLMEERVTILSDDCWSGYVYHWMRMRFYTPLINIYWRTQSYVKFIQMPEYYLSCPLVMEREANVRRNQCAIGSLGDDDNKVYLELVHSVTFEEAKRLWDRRVQRINKKKFFIKLALDASDKNCDHYLEVFSQIPYKKVCFYSGITDCNDVVYLKGFELYVLKGNRMETINYYDYVRNMSELTKGIDLFKMLNGECGFIREGSISTGGYA